jgi:hypothetical protein
MKKRRDAENKHEKQDTTMLRHAPRSANKKATRLPEWLLDFIHQLAESIDAPCALD